jgi:energy-coupling factor transporter ATP-binding protein EcfA2
MEGTVPGACDGFRVSAPVQPPAVRLCDNRCSMDVSSDRDGLPGRLAETAATLGGFSLGLAGPSAEAERVAAHRAITGYLLPRLTDPDGPLVVAVVGQSGSGKSTLVNSLAEDGIAQSGALRPTTRRPTAWSVDGVPAALEEVWTALEGRVRRGARRPPEGLVVVDAPPPDVPAPGGGSAAATILERSDACVFVASGSRYADAVGWNMLGIAARRRLPTVFVLNRLPEDRLTRRMVIEDMARRLAGRGMLPRPDPELLLGITNSEVIPEIGGLIPDTIAILRKELSNLSDPQARIQVVESVVQAALASTARSVAAVRRGIVEERGIRAELTKIVEEAYGAEASALRGSADAGDLGGAGGDRDRMTAGLAAVVTHRAGRAARAAASAWDLHPVGNRLLSEDGGLWGHGPRVLAAARAEVEQWIGSLDGVVMEWSGKRRMGRRRLARLSAAAARSAVDGSWVPSGRMLRRLERIGGAVIGARRALGSGLSATLLTDAARFRQAVGPEIPAVIEERLGSLEEVPR